MKAQILGLQLRAQQIIALLSLTLGALLLFSGSYIHLKAQLAQVLISSAWQQSKLSDTLRSPWPWADTQVVGRITYLDKSQFVLAGESGRNLAFGPALMSASAPLNERDNSVIVGHRDTHFSDIKHLKTGDIIVLESIHGAIQYKVSERAIIQHTDISVLASTDFGALTLITCYPFNTLTANPNLRYVVRATAV